MPKAASVKRAARRQKQRDSEAMAVDEERKRTKEVKRKKDQAEKSQAARNKKKLALKLAPGRVSYRAAMGDDAPESPHWVHDDNGVYIFRNRRHRFDNSMLSQGLEMTKNRPTKTKEPSQRTSTIANLRRSSSEASSPASSSIHVCSL